MERELNCIDILKVSICNASTKSSIMKTLGTKLSYEEAKIVSSCSKWRKF